MRGNVIFSWLKHGFKVLGLLGWLKGWNGGIVVVTSRIVDFVLLLLAGKQFSFSFSFSFMKEHRFNL